MDDPPSFWAPRLRYTALQSGRATDAPWEGYVVCRVLMGRVVQGEGVEPWGTLRIPFGKIGEPLGKIKKERGVKFHGNLLGGSSQDLIQ